MSASASPNVEIVILDGVRLEHATEVAKLSATIVRYRELLEQHGIEPPDDAGEEALEMFRRCRRAAELARALVDALDEIRSMT